jgi:hypothetical protein
MILTKEQIKTNTIVADMLMNTAQRLLNGTMRVLQASERLELDDITTDFDSVMRRPNGIYHFDMTLFEDIRSLGLYIEREPLNE